MESTWKEDLVRNILKEQEEEETLVPEVKIIKNEHILKICNIRWRDIIKANDNLLQEISNIKDVNKDFIIIVEKNNFIPIILDNRTLIPKISEYIKFKLLGDPELGYHGALLEQRNGDFGCICYIPFIITNKNKKFVSFFKIVNKDYIFFYYEMLHNEHLIEDIIIPTDLTPFEDELTDKEKLICEKTSKQFLKFLLKSNNRSELIEYVLQELLRTSDKNFIKRIFHLLNYLTFDYDY